MEVNILENPFGFEMLLLLNVSKITRHVSWRHSAIFFFANSSSTLAQLSDNFLFGKLFKKILFKTSNEIVRQEYLSQRLPSQHTVLCLRLNRWLKHRCYSVKCFQIDTSTNWRLCKPKCFPIWQENNLIFQMFQLHRLVVRTLGPAVYRTSFSTSTVPKAVNPTNKKSDTELTKKSEAKQTRSKLFRVNELLLIFVCGVISLIFLCYQIRW